MKKILFLFIVLFLIAGCATTYESSLQLDKTTGTEKNIIQHNCPMKLEGHLNPKTNCSTKEYSGIKIISCWKDQQRHGTECGYQEEGKLFYEQNWINGKQHGLDIEYFYNGNIKLIKTYVNGELFGLYKQFFENGNLIFDGYRDGDCALKYGTCYTEDGIAVPVKEEYLNKACYNMLCLDTIKQQHTNKP